jgi:catechol-2,3-dioxygenase
MKQPKLGVLAHTHIASSQKAKAGRKSKDQGQPGLHRAKTRTNKQTKTKTKPRSAQSL